MFGAGICFAMVRLRRSGALVLAAASIAALLAPGPAGAAGLGVTTRSVGAWDLKLDDGSRQCRVNLRSSPAAQGYEIAMPAGCRRAFPILSAVATWMDGGEDKLQFGDEAGQPVLSFQPASGGALTGTSPEGQIYRLEPVGQHRVTILKTAAKAGSKAAAKPAPKLPLPSVAEMAGRYSVLREKGKDTGCMVTFDDKAHGPKGSFKANLAPACRDQGIVIFDPVGWQLQGGRLVLTARKGHTTKLDLQENGSWTKDATEGKSLSLKKM